MSEDDKILANHCVKCEEEMEYGISFDGIEKTVNLSICHNDKCQNYGLLQLGKEAMFVC
ncbi:MAG: hypothetical protein ACTSR1_00175 [Candidatus Heimdallarchaeota archaeon]